MTTSVGEGVTAKAAPPAAPIIYVCITCRPVGEPAAPSYAATNSITPILSENRLSHFRIMR